MKVLCIMCVVTHGFVDPPRRRARRPTPGARAGEGPCWTTPWLAAANFYPCRNGDGDVEQGGGAYLYTTYETGMAIDGADKHGSRLGREEDEEATSKQRRRRRERAYALCSHTAGEVTNSLTTPVR